MIDRQVSQTSGGDQEERILDSATLLSARKEAVIVHRGERYRLRETSKGKLILTK